MLRALLSIRLITSLAAAALGAGALAQQGTPAPAASPSPRASSSSAPQASPTPAAMPDPRPSATPTATPTPGPAPSSSATPTPAPAPTAAAEEAEQPPAALAGNWDLRIDGTTIFRFVIERTGTGGWQGRWQRPDSFNSNGNAFANLRGPLKSTASMAGNAVGPLVELAFDDPRPGAVPDIFRFRLIGPDAVAMGYVGTQLPPYLLVRAGPDAPLGNWDAARIYRRPVPGAPATAAPAPAAPAPAATAAPSAARTASPPPPQVIQPSADGRIILGPQVRFLDLTPREVAEEGEAPEARENTAEAEEAAPATAGPSAAPAPAPPPASAPPAPATPAPAPTQPGIGADFLEGL